MRSKSQKEQDARDNRLIAAILSGDKAVLKGVTMESELRDKGDTWQPGFIMGDGLISVDIDGVAYTSTRDIGGLELRIASYIRSNNEKSPHDIRIIGADGFSAEQQEALMGSAGHKLAVIQGGPGTGKSTIMSAALKSARASGLDVALCAPTGVAAKRLNDTTDFLAETMHRLLGYKRGEFAFNRENRLPYNYIVVDESSMAGIDIASAFFSALPDDCQVLFVGDRNQLPSVPPGNFFEDIQSVLPTFELTKVFRYNSDGAIGLACKSIINGEIPKDIPDDGSGSGFYTRNLDWDRAREGIKAAVDHMSSRMELMPWDVRVACPTNYAVDLVNDMLREKYKTLVRYPLIQTVNDYQINVMNGEVGLSDGRGNVVFDGGSKIVEKTKTMALAWAVTVHRLQGTEAPGVVMAIPSKGAGMLTRKLVYTAVSRARRFCFGFGDVTSLESAIQSEPASRFTLLKKLVKKGWREKT